MRRAMSSLQALPIAPQYTLALTEYEQRNLSMLDVLNEGVTKGTALAEWARRRGIARDEVMAIGDNWNDREMLEFAGLPVVMENAVPELKSPGWKVTLSNDACGVADAIRTCVLNTDERDLIERGGTMRVFTAVGAAALCTVALLAGGPAFAQQGPPAASTQPPTITSVLDTQLTIIEREFTGAAQAMPEDKYSFAPTNGEFKGVRTFAQEVKHVATVNNRFYGSILGETAPVAPDEGIGSNGPDAIQTKAQIVQYLHDSFAHAHKAIATINADNAIDADGQPGGSVPENAAGARHLCVHARDGSLRPDGRIPAGQWDRSARERKSPACKSTGKDLGRVTRRFIFAGALIAAAIATPRGARGLRRAAVGRQDSCHGLRSRWAIGCGSRWQAATVEIAASDLIDVEPRGPVPRTAGRERRLRGALRQADSRRGAEARRGRKAHRAGDRDGVEFRPQGGFEEAGAWIDAVAAADRRAILGCQRLRPGAEHRRAGPTI